MECAEKVSILTDCGCPKRSGLARGAVIFLDLEAVKLKKMRAMRHMVQSWQARWAALLPLPEDPRLEISGSIQDAAQVFL